MDELIIKDMEPRDKFMFMLLERVGTLEDQQFKNTKQIQSLENKIIFLENGFDPPTSNIQFTIASENTANLKISDYIHTLKLKIDSILPNIKTCDAIAPLLLEIRLGIFDIPHQGSNILPAKDSIKIIIGIVLDKNIYLYQFKEQIKKLFRVFNQEIYYTNNIVLFPENLNSFWIKGPNCFWLFRIKYPQGTIQSCPIINPEQPQYIDYISRDRIEYNEIILGSTKWLLYK